MPVETFSREDFERALPTDKRTGEKLWESLGVQEGEYVYRVLVSQNFETYNRFNKTRPIKEHYAVSIIIRSSVRASGVIGTRCFAILWVTRRRSSTSSITFSIPSRRRFSPIK